MTPEQRREEIRRRVERDEYNLPLQHPDEVERPLIILAPGVSRCCGQNSLLVRSREGGYVAKDCLECRKSSDYARLRDIPNLDCANCRQQGHRGTVQPFENKSDHGNYWYKCSQCHTQWRLAELLPSWKDIFEEAGLIAPGDPGWTR